MKNMFNIYYINNEKASEISMLFDNQIVEKNHSNQEYRISNGWRWRCYHECCFQNSCYRTVFTKHRSEWKFIS